MIDAFHFYIWSLFLPWKAWKHTFFLVYIEQEYSCFHYDFIFWEIATRGLVAWIKFQLVYEHWAVASLEKTFCNTVFYLVIVAPYLASTVKLLYI